MQGRQLAASLSCILLVSPSLIAQQSTASQQGAILLQRAHAAMTRGAAVSDVTLTGTARRIAGSDDETGTATLKALATGESRIDLSFPSGPRAEVRADSANGPAGKWTAPDGSSHAIAQHNLHAGTSWFFLPFTLASALSAKDSVVYHLGQETFDGTSVEYLSISRQFTTLPADATTTLLQHLSQMEIYLDSTTLLPLALTFNTHPDNNALLDIPVIIRFSDYRSAGGVAPGFSPAASLQIPFHVQKFINNRLVLDLQFQSATFNSGLSASLFTVEAGLQPGSASSASLRLRQALSPWLRPLSPPRR